MPCLQDTGAGHRQGVRAWTRKPAVQSGPQARELRCRALPCHGVRRDHACPLLRSRSTCEATSVTATACLSPAGACDGPDGTGTRKLLGAHIRDQRSMLIPCMSGYCSSSSPGRQGELVVLWPQQTHDQIPVNSMAPNTTMSLPSIPLRLPVSFTTPPFLLPSFSYKRRLIDHVSIWRGE